MLDKTRKIYVLDTNILVDYPNIIPGDDKKYRPPEDATIDFSGQHLVIPDVVRQELGKFKGESSARGEVASLLLKRFRWLTNNNLKSLGQAYSLEAARDIGNDTLLTFAPIHPDFRKALPFQPDENDKDGQIILTAIAVMHALNFKERMPGWAREDFPDWKERGKYLNITTDRVVILTNDNELASRAHDCGISTDTYGYNVKTYTGRRDVTVPNDVFIHFWREGKIDLETWNGFVPGEEPFVANEFVIMTPENPEDKDLPLEFLCEENNFFRHVGRYDAEERAIVRLKYVSEAPYRVKNDGQAILTEALLNPDISAVICTGPAGSGKTYLPTVYGLSSLARKVYGRIVVVPCSNTGNRGALPGDLNAKMALDTGPFRNAIRNYLKKDAPRYLSEKARREAERVSKRAVTDLLKEATSEDFEPVDQLDEMVENLWKRHFRNIPVESARGLDFSGDLVLYDEFQDQSPVQADMLIKRLGEGGKIVITGDIKQIHARYVNEVSNGISYATGLLYGLPMVARVSLLKDEVVRHLLVKIIAEKQDNA